MSDDDKTAQGALGRGTMKLIYFIAIAGLLLGLIDGFMRLIGAK